MKEKVVLDSLKDLLADKDSLINHLQEKLEKLKIERRKILNDDPLLAENQQRLIDLDKKISDLNQSLMDLLENTINVLKKDN